MENPLYTEIFIGKSPINGPFFNAMFDYRRVDHISNLEFLIFIQDFRDISGSQMLNLGDSQASNSWDFAGDSPAKNLGFEEFQSFTKDLGRNCLLEI